MDPKNSNFFSNSLEHLVEGSDYQELTVQFTTCTEAILVGYIHFIISLVQISKRVILCTEKKACHCQCFTIVFATLAASNHLHVICQHLVCLMPLFQDYVGCRNFTVRE